MDFYLNPCKPVPPDVLELCKLPADFNSFLSTCPTFKDKAKEILAYLNQGILAGFAVLNFDLPLTWEELYRAGQIWLIQDRPVIDVKEIFHKMEPRDLTAAVKFYCGRPAPDAHSAVADVVSARSVFMAQMARYPDLNAMTTSERSKFCQPDDRVDLEGKIVRNKDGVPCYAIGNAETKGTPVLEKPDFARWMLSKDFSNQTKMVLRDILGQADKQKELLLDVKK